MGQRCQSLCHTEGPCWEQLQIVDRLLVANSLFRARGKLSNNVVAMYRKTRPVILAAQSAIHFSTTKVGSQIPVVGEREDAVLQRFWNKNLGEFSNESFQGPRTGQECEGNGVAAVDLVADGGAELVRFLRSIQLLECYCRWNSECVFNARSEDVIIKIVVFFYEVYRILLVDFVAHIGIDALGGVRVTFSMCMGTP